MAKRKQPDSYTNTLDFSVAKKRVKAAYTDDILRSAHYYLERGELGHAKLLYEKVLERDPRQANALHLLGVIFLNWGSYQSAEEFVWQAVELNRKEPLFYRTLSTIYKKQNQWIRFVECYQKIEKLKNLMLEDYCDYAHALQMIGQYDQSLSYIKKILARQPDNVIALNELAIILRKNGYTTDAIEYYSKILDIQPDFKIALSNLVNCYIDTEEYDKAESYLIRLRTLDSQFPEAPYHAARILEHRCEWENARKAYMVAISISSHLGAYHRLAALLEKRWGIDQAIEIFEACLRHHHADQWSSYQLSILYDRKNNITQSLHYARKTLEINPNFAEAHHLCGLLYLKSSDMTSAFLSFFSAIRLAPNLHEARLFFSEILPDVNLSIYSPEVEEEIIKCFAAEDIDFQKLQTASYQLIDIKYQLMQNIQSILEGNFDFLKPMLDDELFQLCLRKTINQDPLLEGFLTKYRRGVFMSSTHANNDRERLVFSSLAEQAHNNQYVWAITPEETLKLEKIKQRLDQMDPQHVDQDLLLLFSLYQNPNTLVHCDVYKKIPLSYWHASLISVIEKTLLDDDSIQFAKEKIIILGEKPASDSYDLYPYPRWLSCVMHSFDVFNHLKFLMPELVIPNEEKPFKKVLIAGCGTGYSAVSAALNYQHCQIKAIDSSEQSLMIGQWMANKYDLQNCEFYLGDFNQLELINDKFELIECSTISHRYADFNEVLKYLVDALVDDGILRITFYSEIMRQFIQGARFICDEAPTFLSKQDIQSFRQAVMGNSAAHGLLKFPEFYDLNGAHDLMQRANGKGYTLSEIGELLQRHELKFIGFVFDAPIVKQAFLQKFDEVQWSDLECWEIFEKEHPDTFRGRYQVCCQR